MLKTVNFDSFDALINDAGKRIKFLAEAAVSSKGIFTMALAGGSTPAALYLWLSCRENWNAPWDKIHFFWGDERLVPLDSELSNYRMVNENLLSKISIPPENTHIPEVSLSPEQAAADYETEIRNFGTVFDLILLGIGPDGHTASLFPDTASLQEKQKLVITVPPPTTAQPAIPRITFTLPLINQAGNIIILATGEEKYQLLNSPDEYPFKMIENAEILFTLKK